MQNRIVGVIGPTGSGKTTWAANHFSKRDRAAVFNTANEPAFYTGAEAVADDLPSLIREMDNERFRVVLDCDDNTKVVNRGGQIELVYYDLDPFLESCFYIGNVWVYLDEAHDLCKRTTATYWLLRTARRGRRNGVNVVWISQRFQTIHTSLTGNSHEYIFFAGIKEPMDLDAIEDRCGKETVAAIRAAKLFQPVRWTTEGGLES